METLAFILQIALMMGLAFVQNMAFTWSSRSRNSADPDHHRRASWCSNGVWFAMQVTIWSTLFQSLTSGDWWKLFVTGIAYTIATSEGSVYQMRRMLRTESGKRKVGAS